MLKGYIPWQEAANLCIEFTYSRKTIGVDLEMDQTPPPTLSWGEFCSTHAYTERCPTFLLYSELVESFLQFLLPPDTHK